MNAKELAKAVGVHHNTIYNMIKKGELKAEKKNKTYEVDEDQAQKLITSKRLLKAEENASTGVDEVITLIKENQRQTFLKIIEYCMSFSAAINSIVNNGKDINDISTQKELLKIADDPIFEYLSYLIKSFEENKDMIWNMENIKDKYSIENYHSNNTKRMKEKYEELEFGLIKYSLEDYHVKASNSLILHKSDL